MEEISRREYLKITAVVGAGLASTQILGSERLLKEVTVEEAEGLKEEAEQVETYIRSLTEGGFAPGWCGGATVAVDVKNGKILRIRPLHFDWKFKPEEFNPWKLEINGKVFEPPLKALPPPYALSYKKRIYAPSRVRYPLKRVDWSPTERNPQNRGKSGFVRITWDEATDTIASEFHRIRQEYGPYGILSQADGHGETKTVHNRPGATNYLLQCPSFGGNTTLERNPDSWEGFFWGGKHVWGMDGNMGISAPQSNGMVDFLENGELALFWGSDPETTPWGHGPACMMSIVCHWLREAGKKVIYVCPDLNYGAAVHANRWIPVLPNTDIALHLAIAYIWITEGTYDKDFIATHTFGFEYFKKYVLGEEDGVPKTPKWAEEICGVPTRIIKALARLWAKKRTSIWHQNGGSMIRGPYADEPGRTEPYLLAMQGIGKPGCLQLQGHEWPIAGKYQFPYSKIIPVPGAALRSGVSQPQILYKTYYHKGILNPPISWYGGHGPVQRQFVKYTYPVEGYPEIHAIWMETPCWTVCWNGGFMLTEAFRSPKIEFILAQHQWLEDDALFADIVLPVTTTLENDIDIMSDNANGQYALLFIQYRCIEPIGESKSDVEVCEAIAEKMGSKFTEYKDLLTEFTKDWTHEEWAKFGFDKSGATALISWEEFLEKQYVVSPTDPEWSKARPFMSTYYELPEGTGLNTKSGKIEFYCQWLAEHFPDDKERPPVARYIPYGESHQESLVHPRAKKYPLLLVSNHKKWAEHAEHEADAWLREIPTFKQRGIDGYQYQPIWIHPIDAAKRGIKHGDIVKMYNERGTVLGIAYITERTIPRAVNQDHGAALDILSLEDRIDRGGSNNLIAPDKTTSKNAAGIATSGYLVEVEKVDIFELMKKYPEAFKRKIDPEAGPYYDTWVVG